MNQPEPVFIHSQWRTAKTAFWAVLRGQPGLRCYYEPFHEVLRTLPASRARGAPETGHAGLDHPALDAPTFAEFASLVGPLGGVRDFRARFAYEDFFLPEGAEDPSLQQYLETLVGEAADEGRRPVLAFSRSSLRVGWMRRHMGGFHLGIVRHPHRQWASYQRLAAGGNRYFQPVTLLTFFKALGEVLGGMDAEDGGVRVEVDLALYRQMVASCEAGDVYFAFYVLWWLGALHMDRACHCVVDLTSADSGRLEALSEVLAEQGLALDPSRFRADHGAWAPEGAEAIEAAARAWVAERGQALLPRERPEGAAVGSDRRRLVGPEVRAHLEGDGAGSAALAEAEERVERLVGVRERALLHLLRWQMPGPSVPATVGGRGAFAWSSTQLRRIRGGELRPCGRGLGMACNPSFAMAQAFSPAVALPAGRYRVDLLLEHGEAAGEVPIGFRAGRQGGSGDEYLPLTFRRFQPEEGGSWQPLGHFELDEPARDGAVGLAWSERDVCVVGLRLVREAEPATQESAAVEAPAVAEAFPGHLDFSASGNASRYTVQGFHPAESNGCWTRAAQADLALPTGDGLPPVTSVRMKLRPLTHPILRPAARVAMYIDGRLVGEEWLTRNAAEVVSWALPDDLGTSRDALWMSITVDDLVSPWALGKNADKRLLGVRLFWIAFEGDAEVA